MMKMTYSDLTHHYTNNTIHEVFYIVIYWQGDTSRIAVACAQDFDVPDYVMASRYLFDDESNAAEYAADLARKHGLMYSGTHTPLLD